MEKFQNEKTERQSKLCLAYKGLNPFKLESFRLTVNIFICELSAMSLHYRCQLLPKGHTAWCSGIGICGSILFKLQALKAYVHNLQTKLLTYYYAITKKRKSLLRFCYGVFNKNLL